MAWKGAISKSLQELRIHLCQSGPASSGVREFLISNYAEIKKANPGFPLLVRECSGIEAKLIARYDFGVEKSVSIQGDNPQSIISKLDQLIKHGESLPKAA
ncbi:hypothetical protein CEUSTIGMA_g1853.t1 [Chlamydomonas eustigma]|uniref:Ribosomal protein/NADH dehydrogenase domain-containing protein n=1 Tax=Chlamydomonas eustigma TaxID=1157962 RepID=A0A250WUD7_9CHLO|nr:hypothetical protein CEUSTIGMA_g1853.t1 [Chlamydomonas eustigma]|eukprot:GAX74405.1 hypothetical protein CEUSTIGMA_g1853.t1 [Chlamydomonas eustigma]